MTPVTNADRRLSLEEKAALLVALAEKRRSHRPAASGGTQLGALVLCRLDDIAEPTPEFTSADQALKNYADVLAAEGGLALMVEVYDEATAEYGHRAVSGVSPAWSGLHGWWQ